jgi:hypothetical protein
VGKNIESATAAWEISSEDFIGALCAGTLAKQSEGRSVVVRGDVDLRDNDHTAAIVEIPEVSIIGNLVADGSCALRTCRCGVDGNVTLDGSLIEEFAPKFDPAGSVRGLFSAKECKNLRWISGKFNNDVNLNSSSIVEVGLDFSTSGELYLKGCTSLQKVNCSAWSIIADESSLSEVGSKTSAENFSAQNCSMLETAFPIEGLEWAKYDGSGVKEVPPSFYCDGPVYLNRCKKLRKLSGKMVNLEVSAAPLEQVSDLESDEIIFSECKKIPKNMTRIKAKYVIFDGCAIEKLPPGIPESSSVRIGACPNFSRLPAFWRGGLSLTGLPALEESPAGFHCGGNLDVEDCPNFSKLRGKVGGDLWLLSGLGRLRELGPDLTIVGDLTMSGLSEVEKLRCKIGRDVVAGRSLVIETGPELLVGGDLDLHGCSKLVVVRGKVSGMAMLDDSSVSALGADFECGGDLCVRETEKLTSLNCAVGGRVLASNSSLRKTGPAFQCAKSLNVTGCSNFEIAQGKIGGRVRRDISAPMKRNKETRHHPPGLAKLARPVPSRSSPPPTMTPDPRG